jgi:PPOX class probable F420-dependent enzyme
MLEDVVVTLAQGPTFASVTTLLPDNTPMTQPLWIDTDGEHLIFNTETGRQKYRNIERDPRVTVMLLDPADPYKYAEVRGRVVETETGPKARDHIDALARKYTGADYAGTVQTERVIVRVAPFRQYIRG